MYKLCTHKQIDSFLISPQIPSHTILFRILTNPIEFNPSMPSKLDKDKVCADLPLPQPPQSFRKSFKLLKTHAASVANFTLQWQDLEDHFVAIHNSIQSKLHQLQPNQTHLTPTLQSQPNSQKTQIDSKETILIPTLESQPICKETQLSSALESQEKSKKTQVKNEESLPENEYFNGIPIYNGKALLLYLKEHLREHESMRNDIYNALKVSVDSGKLVFEAVRWYHLQEMKEDRDIGVSVLRRSCVLLLEELMRVGPVVKAEVREEAVKLALEWKEKVGEEMENSWEVLRFLLLVAAFGLMAEFDGDEILKLLIGIVPRKIAPELFRALGFADKAPDFIQKLISQNKRLEAIKFIFACELVDMFPPVPTLKDHLKLAKKALRRSRKRKSSLESPAAKNELTNREISAIRTVIKCIDEYKLGSQYCTKDLRKRIQQLKKQKDERNAIAAASVPRAHVQQQSKNKRTAIDRKACPDKQSRNKRLQTDASHASVNAALSIHSVHPSYHQREGFFVGQGAEYLDQSAGMTVAASIPNVSIGTTLTIPSGQLAHHQPESSFAAQDAQYLTPSAGQYNLARSSPDPTRVSLSCGPYGYLYPRPITHYTNLTVGHYGTVGSQPGTTWSSSSGRYQFWNKYYCK